MKIFVAHSSNYDFKNELYQPLRNSDLYQKHTIILPQLNGKEVTTQETIKSCDMIVAEISYPSTGQGIELGWADIFAIPIVCMYKEGYKYSSSLAHITDKFFSYKNSQDLISKLKNEIKFLERR